MCVKECSNCKKEKNKSEFYICKGNNDGLNAWCKVCSRMYSRKWREENKKKQKKYWKEYYEENKEKILNKNEKHRKNNKEYYKQYSKKWREENSDYCVVRRKENLEVKLKHVLRNRISNALNKDYKSYSAEELLGCTIEELKKHLEKQFEEGMTWDNHSLFGWHIDHIKTCASFDLTDPKHQKECFHYTNLRPLWSEDNWSRSKFKRTNNGKSSKFIRNPTKKR